LRTPLSCSASGYWNRPSRKLFCFGLGYVGFAFAKYLKPLGWYFAYSIVVGVKKP